MKHAKNHHHLRPYCFGQDLRCAIELARRFGGEIVSADSQQIWRGFDVGTAKPDKAEQSSVSHHLIDVADPEERFDAPRFVALADAAVVDIAPKLSDGARFRFYRRNKCVLPPIIKMKGA